MSGMRFPPQAKGCHSAKAPLAKMPTAPMPCTSGRWIADGHGLRFRTNTTPISSEALSYTKKKAQLFAYLYKALHPTIQYQKDPGVAKGCRLQFFAGFTFTFLLTTFAYNIFYSEALRIHHSCTWKVLRSTALRANGVQQEVIKEAFKGIGKLYKKGIEIVCPDGKIRWRHPILAGWIADYMEYTKLFSICNKTCPVCTCTALTSTGSHAATGQPACSPWTSRLEVIDRPPRHRLLADPSVGDECCTCCYRGVSGCPRRSMHEREV
ncbi:hypothetical protein BJ508DRAFT_127671 [Ascobolus immersus RN42]|uniref:Uncharacterized protein n=1 Tax=Ascobolus immersus RN42 TaxID=1160509 RepID=A0A3N4IFR0_ASCIM|nr:hypothetical protein BJ508DRAFT_127671 [Ascobolus immersus RN42]